MSNNSININYLSDTNILDIKRDDLLHPHISGNKFRKLKFTILEAKKIEAKTLLTFGGAFSNHIAAVAAAGKIHSFNTIGVIRGEELVSKVNNNPTLSYAKAQGMQLFFVSREQYKDKESPEFINLLHQKFGEFYNIPEGGTNDLAVQGCAGILTPQDLSYDYVCVSVGTGGTIAGIVTSAAPHQHVLGFSALKGTFQKEIISKYSENKNFTLIDDYCFGGYAKIDLKLIRFINEFKENHNISLDPVYTGKLFYGIFDLLKNGYFRENSRILAVHTGGLQGIAGMNEKLKKKNLPTINV
ncbi:1-aminocyclopropane-1-carboxylate deaminase [Patiriisocius marinistellae]|uniref:1-aminocyclopropane-1-carboxylate deaminase n=1 Tax=Patiriisocius marinistellae TaxID=2494560 RepID=A0A5J4FZD0_9FLAO|nr:pyridoxal-phosphate dependent enzyme [Patiriisocius marinistellae]GEQ85529.1 1-aminocyclopropane-1-carboxylate deaminase [Patiriisocius marinistellae]